jgi:GMP synthase-like glutamine amidotransferase
MALGERAWSVQGHPEFTPELADHLLAGRTDLIGVSRVERARATLSSPTDRQRVAQWIAATFAAP